MISDTLTIANVSQTFAGAAGEPVEVLKDVSLTVGRNEFISIIGPSGCGKTTLLRLIAGLSSPLSGELLMNGAPIKTASSERGYIFQSSGLFPWLTVEKNIAAGLKARGLYKARKSEVQRYVDLVGLGGFEKSYPHQISGGMAQRAAIARALINNPEVLLLDEPLGALDSFTRMSLQDELIRLWRERGNTMVMVTHDIDEAIYLSRRIVMMSPRPGRIVQILDVPMSYPRNRAAGDFTALRTQILKRMDFARDVQEEYAI
ncbi:MAG: ABC transporter ATP-binding protein [Oscillospiraceae bacterium]|jgi:ABC-type nitrate/sulfonate/bicarbonate transport system ATPase subunit|nr:ABC transporter ATP-binding protein [Oscillospiraceae bacterium]